MTSLCVFIHDDKAVASLEAVLWAPVYVIVLAGITDASLLYLTHTEMWNTARATARRISVGALGAAGVSDYVSDKLLLGGRNYTFAASYDDPVAVEISVNVGDASVFGIFQPVLERQLTARVEMRKEPEPSAF